MNTKTGKLIPIAAFAAAIACGVVRFFQIVSLTDLDSGFFFRGSELGGSVVYIMLALFAAVLCAFAFIGNKRGDAAFTLSSDGMGSNATRVLGIAEILGAFLIGLHVTDADSTIAVSCFTGAAALALFASGGMLMARIIPPPATGHLKLIAALYVVVRAVIYYNTDLVVLNHAEHLIVLLALTAGIPFMLAYARFCARLETARTRLGEVIFAILTFLLSATHAISDLLAMAFGGKAAAEFVSIDLDASALAIMSCAYLAVLFFTGKSRDIIPLKED